MKSDGNNTAKEGFIVEEFIEKSEVNVFL